MNVVPLFGSGVAGKSFVVTRQRRLNCYYENRPDGDKGAKVVVYGTPGKTLRFAVASSLNTPLRAMLGTDTALYVVVYNQFQSLNASGVATFTGAIGTIQGLASMALNPNASQLLLVDGAGGWIYTPATGTFLPAPVGSWFVPGSMTVTNVAGYFVTEQFGTANFNVSNINDASAGSALSFASASQYPDILKAVDNLGGNLVLFSAQHMEFWQNIGAPPPAQPFAAIQSATNEWGLAAIFSRGHVQDSICFLGQTRQGKRHVCQVKGYGVFSISEEIDAIINTQGFTYADATALTFEEDKHPFYQITFPTMNRTFLYDLSTGIWNEGQTGLTQDGPVRDRGNLSTYYAGETLVSDYQNGNVYRLDGAVFTDNGAPILREVITRHAVKGFNRFRIPLVYLDMETGVGTLSGQGADPVISIECSKDNGRTWGFARFVRVGALGEYLTRAVARRFGQARVFTFRIRMTDPVKFVVTNGAIEARGKRATK